jgi:hypothetical protein
MVTWNHPALPAQRPTMVQANQPLAAPPTVNPMPGMANTITAILGLIHLPILPAINPAAFQIMQPEGPASALQQPADQPAARQPQVFQPGAENPLYGVHGRGRRGECHGLS